MEDGEQRNYEEEYYTFSQRTYMLILSFVALVTLLVFLFSIVFYGTGCPQGVAAADSIQVAYSATIYKFSHFHCYNPAKWFNPKTISESSETTDPTDIFLGLFLAPPGLTMFFGLFYLLAFGLIYSLAFMGALQRNHRMLNTARKFSHYGLVLNVAVLFINVFSSLFLIVREGANNYSVNNTFLCAAFAKLAWPMCSYVYSQTVFFVLFTLYNLLAISYSRGVVREITDETKEGGEPDDVLIE